MAKRQQGKGLVMHKVREILRLGLTCGWHDRPEFVSISIDGE